jgi:hypothetical protein
MASPQPAETLQRLRVWTAGGPRRQQPRISAWDMTCEVPRPAAPDVVAASARPWLLVMRVHCPPERARSGHAIRPSPTLVIDYPSDLLIRRDLQRGPGPAHMLLNCWDATQRSATCGGLERCW